MRKLVIANRGEIARRVLRTARERGYEVAVISTPSDEDALVRREADEVLEVESFLSLDAIVAASKAWGAGFLHPGYGFLSENAAFAERLEAAGIVFVGPTAEAMRALGNKESAKELARKNDVPTLASVKADELTRLEAEGIAPPFLVKAAGGGGGRGMRIVQSARDLPASLARASEEAKAGFSDPTVFVERFLENPRHIEIQVFGDGKGKGTALGERECSIQRRYQKVIEEAPSPVVDEALREKMCRAAMRLVGATRYRGAGTVEFLLDHAGAFYFLEVNTRLQVEHPVTEAVYGLDLVACQLELAEGAFPSSLPPPGSKELLTPNGWATEARVLAEDPRADFLPTPGALHRYREPFGEGLRLDSGVAEGGRVHPAFDSMIAKVIAHGANRAESTERLARALSRLIVHGPTTNLSFLQNVLEHPEYRAGRIGTRFIADHLAELNRSRLPDGLEGRLTSKRFREALSFALRSGRVETAGPLAARFRSLGEPRLVETVDLGSGAVEPLGAVATVLDPESMALTLAGETLRLEDPRASVHRRSHLEASDGEVRAPMAGKVLEVHVEAGDAVDEGSLLLVLESMKMQLEVRAPVAGRLEVVHVRAGDVLDGPELLLSIAPAASSADDQRAAGGG